MNKKKIVVWEGFKKELPWIIFWIFILIIAIGYYQDKKICDEVLADPCSICYKLNETLININDISFDIIINETLLYKDKNPNDRSISNLE